MTNRNQQVNLCLRAVSHIVDEGDLAPDVGEVAPVAIEEDGEGFWGGFVLRPGRERSQQGYEAQGEEAGRRCHRRRGRLKK